MTGQGQGRTAYGSAEICAEVRAVNNRHLKVHTRTCDSLSGLEPKIESLLREHVRRGSLQVTVQRIGGTASSVCQLQVPVLESYVTQCKSVAKRLEISDEIQIADLLDLPGVLVDPKLATSMQPVDKELAEAALKVVQSAVDSLNDMRQTEGDSMLVELSSQLERLVQLTEAIRARAPVVIDDFRSRLTSRIEAALAESTASLQESDLIREIAILADKADIREELVRLGSHFDQFSKLLDASESQGRKLDFLIQELFRETNTIGSKAGDAEIAQLVVDMKTTIEQMRELVQNAE